MGSETECGGVETGNEKDKILIEAPKKHVCPYMGCQSSFNRPWKLNRHINTHTKQRPFKCDHPGCTKDYTNKSHLDRHKSLSHLENKSLPVLVPCPYPDCSKVFTNKWNVKRHCKIHKSKDSYNCNQCGASFKKSRHLKHHLSIHLDVKLYVCESCQKSFETRKELNFHRRKHKVYTCEHQECQQQFNTWNAFRKHLKLCHSTVYKCDSCSKTFKNKWTLREHVFSHFSDDKRDVFACPYDGCERFYFHQRNLIHHLKSFHRNINHKCEVENCNQTFVKKMDLKKHQSLQHGEMTVSEKCAPKVKKPKKPRKPRSDKGQPKKSMAAMLSGIILPYHTDKNLAQNNITSEVLESIQIVKDTLLKT